MNEQEKKLLELYENAQKISDSFSERAGENYGRFQESKKTEGDRIAPLPSIDKESRSINRRIQREIKRYAATGRVSNFLSEQLQKAENESYSDNNSPSSAINQSRSENAPAKIEIQQPLQPSIIPKSESRIINSTNNQGIIPPFYCTSQGNGKIKVNFGKVNDIVPNDMSENEPFYVDAIDNGFIYVVVNFDDAPNGTYSSRTIQDVEILSTDEDILDESNYQSFAIVIAKMLNDDSGILRVKQVRTGNIQFREYFTLVNGQIFLDYAYTYVDEPVSVEI